MSCEIYVGHRYCTIISVAMAVKGDGAAVSSRAVWSMEPRSGINISGHCNWPAGSSTVAPLKGPLQNLRRKVFGHQMNSIPKWICSYHLGLYKEELSLGWNLFFFGELFCFVKTRLWLWSFNTNGCYVPWNLRHHRSEERRVGKECQP